MLKVKNLTKKFKSFVAVDNIGFEIKKGEIVGLLGPNGAGKTTTIHMLLGLITPTSGTIEILNKEFSSAREEILSQINFSSAYIQFLGKLTVWENLVFFAKLYNVKDYKEKIPKLLLKFEIPNLKDTLFYKLSSGERTRVILTKTLLNDPKLLLLDEPTASLDPDIADKTRQFLKELHKEKGITMLYTSHNMAEIEEMCDRVIFLNHGKIVEEFDLSNIEVKKPYLEEIFLQITREQKI